MNPQNYGLAFHHFGLVVSDVSRTLRFLKGLGYKPGEPIHDLQQNVNLVWCEHLHMPPVELVASNGSPGKEVSFYMIKGFGLVELLQR